MVSCGSKKTTDSNIYHAQVKAVIQDFANQWVAYLHLIYNPWLWHVISRGHSTHSHMKFSIVGNYNSVFKKKSFHFFFIGEEHFFFKWHLQGQRTSLKAFTYLLLENFYNIKTGSVWIFYPLRQITFSPQSVHLFKKSKSKQNNYQLNLWQKKRSAVWKQPRLKLFSFTASTLGAVFLRDWCFPVSYSYCLR